MSAPAPDRTNRSGREVVAVEPSTVMLEQRAAGAAPAVRAIAEALPFARPEQFDAAMAISTLHHWHDGTTGIDEMLTGQPHALW